MSRKKSSNKIDSKFNFALGGGLLTFGVMFLLFVSMQAFIGENGHNFVNSAGSMKKLGERTFIIFKDGLLFFEGFMQGLKNVFDSIVYAFEVVFNGMFVVFEEIRLFVANIGDMIAEIFTDSSNWWNAFWANIIDALRIK